MTFRRYFYQSIPHYEHKVYKNHGLVGDEKHEKFYTEWFKTHDSSTQVPSGNYEVLIFEGYRGDRITAEGIPFLDSNNPNLWRVVTSDKDKHVRVWKDLGDNNYEVTDTWDSYENPYVMHLSNFVEKID